MRLNGLFILSFKENLTSLFFLKKHRWCTLQHTLTDRGYNFILICSAAIPVSVLSVFQLILTFASPFLYDSSGNCVVRDGLEI